MEELAPPGVIFGTKETSTLGAGYAWPQLPPNVILILKDGGKRDEVLFLWL